MQIDNSSITVTEILKKELNENDNLSIVTGSFSIFAFEHLKDVLFKVPSVRIVFSQFNPSTLSYFEESRSRFGNLLGGINETKFRNTLTQKKIAQEFAEWITKNSEIKVLKEFGRLSRHLICYGDSAIDSASFDGSGLGLCESSELNFISKRKAPESKDLLNFFEQVWHAKNFLDEAKAELLNETSKLTADNTASQIYVITLFHLFKAFISDLKEDALLDNNHGIKSSVVWSKLYKFQRDGVLGAIDKLNKFGGCILADSVGLGKTFEALAVIKYFQLLNHKALVLCPKKLRDNWLIYTNQDKRNILEKDRFFYDVLNHTDLSRYTGHSGAIDLETINWGGYGLLVIDESHNFRNNNPTKGTKNRYQRLMDDIIKSGGKTKVLMLSATPVNNRLNDLKNQIAFITEGNDAALQEQNIKSIDFTLKKAQIQFNEWTKKPVESRTAKELLDALNFDYFKLLDIFTIARSRKHIEKYYGTKDIGKFPTRLSPINIKSDIDALNAFRPLKEVNNDIRRLSLACYAPLKYILPEKKNEYAKRYDQQVKSGSIFKQTDRDESLIHLLRVNLLKRLESSVVSFELTTQRLISQIDNNIASIDHFIKEIEPTLTDTITEEFVVPPIEDIDDFEIDDPRFEPFLVGKNIKVRLQDLDLIRYKQDLEVDRLYLSKILDESKSVKSGRDVKLTNLKLAIKQKLTNPINLGNKKVIVFSAFADTVTYLYEELSFWIKSEFGLHSAYITGSQAKTTLKHPSGKAIKPDLNTLLTHFSPRSKEREKLFPEFTEQIDLLIATDCISEGQNLQDCDYLVNYDIHWNPVRIIQRFGRIDRLGSINERIQLVNFWPNMELDEYINLEARVSGRMTLLDISATGEDNVIDSSSSAMNDLAYRKKQLEELQKQVVDLEDISGGISITDLTLNDFRMDLVEQLKSNREMLSSSPLGLYSVFGFERTQNILLSESNIYQLGVNELKNTFHTPEISDQNDIDKLFPQGVIFCLKDKLGKVKVNPSYPLSPYFVVYVSDEGDIVSSYSKVKHQLDVLRYCALYQNEGHMKSHYEKIDAKFQTKKGLAHYQQLLSLAVADIKGKSDEHSVSSTLFIRGTSLISQEFDMNDFEVVSFLVIA